MENYFLKYLWNTSDPRESYWACEVPGFNIKQVKDFRSLTAQAIPGGDGGYCWVTSDILLPVIPEDGLYIGSDPSSLISLGMRQSITGLFPHLAITDLDSEDSLWNILWKMTLELADPTGVGSWKPLRGSIKHGFKVTLGGEIRDEEFNPLHRAWGPTIAISQADYRRNRVIVDDITERLSLADLQRFTGIQMLKYGIKDSRDLLPIEYKDEGFLGHRSPFGDSFVEDGGPPTASILLENHTPTGSNPGTGWSVVANSIDILKGDDFAKANTDDSESIYRLDDALDTDDHFVEANLSIHWSPGGNPQECDAEVMGRKHGTLSTLTMYEARQQATVIEEDSHNELVKRITGTPTVITNSSVFTIVEDQNYLTRLTMQSDDTITVDRDAAEVISEASQTDITGNLYAGIILDDDGDSVNRADDFLCDDLAAGGDIRNHIIPAYMRING